MENDQKKIHILRVKGDIMTNKQFISTFYLSSLKTILSAKSPFEMNATTVESSQLLDNATTPL